MPKSGKTTIATKFPKHLLLAFEKAILNNMAIELDIQLTKDNVVVVFHDKTLKRMMGINKKSIQTFLDRIKFNNLIDKAEILNWLIINDFEINDDLLWNERKDLWEKIIPDLYRKNEKFKNFVDFLFMFSRINFKSILLGLILFFK